jgi:hypothetical protein
MLGQIRELSLLALALLLAAGCKKSDAPPSSASANLAAAKTGSEFAVKSAVAGGNQLELELTAGPGFHLNAEYPINFQPRVEDGGAKFTEARYDLKDRLERTACADHPDETCAGKARLPFEPSGAGMVSGVFAFSVCNPEKCLIEKAPVAVKLGPP